MSMFASTIGQLYKRGPQRVVRKACDLERMRKTNPERKELAEAMWKSLLLGHVKTAHQLVDETGLTMAGVHSALFRLTNDKKIIKAGTVPSPASRRPRQAWTWKPENEQCK